MTPSNGVLIASGVDNFDVSMFDNRTFYNGKWALYIHNKIF